MSISKAKSFDFIEVLYLLKVCSIEMSSVGCFYWDFFKSQLSEIIEKGNLFVFRQNESVIGILLFSELISNDNNKINWQYNSGKNLIIHFMVHPKWRNKEIGNDFLSFVEKYAVENDFQNIRIDAYEKNTEVLNSLNNLEYKKAGEKHLPNQNSSFICYEKLIK